MIIILTLFTICLSLVHSQSCTNSSDIVEIIFKNYMKHNVPHQPTDVTVEVWIQDISVNSKSAFQLDFYLSEMWLDPRLRYDHLQPCQINISMPGHSLNSLWTPNTAFINSVWHDMQKSPFTNLFVMLYPNGSVWTNARHKVGCPCQFDLSTYPFDSIKCQLTLESFNYNTDSVKMSWTPLGVATMREKMELADFSLTDIINYRNAVEYPSGNWHELTFVMNYQRRSGWYILNSYIPTSLAVVISWLSISFGTKCVAGRSFLCIGSFILITLQSIIINNSITRVSYFKAIDVWIIACQLFVFLMVVELAIIGIMTRKGSEFTDDNDDEDDETLLGTNKKKNIMKRFKKGCCNKIPCMLDTVAGFGFAALFVLFVIIYWAMYSN